MLEVAVWTTVMNQHVFSILKIMHCFFQLLYRLETFTTKFFSRTFHFCERDLQQHFARAT